MARQINIRKYINKDIITIEKRFVGEKTPKDFLKLNNNENTYSMPSDVIDDLRDKLSKVDFTKYPITDISYLQQGLAHFYGCDSDQILIDNGSSVVLESIFRAILKPGDTVVSPTPSFVLYPYLCKLTSTTYLEVDYEDNWIFPENEILDMNANLIVIANPNNPTGTYISLDQIESLLSKTDKIIILDEAYIEFGGESAVPLVKLYPNLIVIRTFSKAFQSAGIRIGFAILNSEIVSQIEKTQPPFHLDVFKQQYIITMLKYQSDFSSTIQQIKQTRSEFQISLEQLGFKLTNSLANFVFIHGHSENISLKDLHKFLKKNKIMIMYYPNTIYDRDYIRITIGTDNQMNTVLETIKEFLGK